MDEISIIVPETNKLPVVYKGKTQSLSDNEVRVKMVAMGYCGRDKSILTGQKSAVPGRIGHEGSGVVIEIGSKVSGVAVGDNILIFPFIGRHNIGYDWPAGGKGIFANYATIPDEAVYKIDQSPDSIEDWIRYALVEPFAGVYRGLVRADINAYKFVVIQGAGPIGCAHAILTKYKNPQAKVILTDTSLVKLETVKRKGVYADIYCTPEQLLGDNLLMSNITDSALVIHANPVKASFKQSFTIAPARATILCFSGIYDWTAEDDEELGFAISPKQMHYEEYESPLVVNFKNKSIRVIGSRGFSREDFEQSAELIINKKIDPLCLVTKILNFDENVLRNLESEGEKESNLKIVMTVK